MEWGRGYRDGYCAALQRLGKTDEEIRELMKNLSVNDDGTPTLYAVANLCCGGVDAHDVACQRRF